MIKTHGMNDNGRATGNFAYAECENEIDESLSSFHEKFTINHSACGMLCERESPTSKHFSYKNTKSVGCKVKSFL